MKFNFTAGLTLAALAVGLSQTAHAATIYALTTTNGLVSFNSAAPGTTSAVLGITGLGVGESLVGIDFRPATGQLFGVGTSNTVYSINTTTGAAVAAGPAFATALSGTSFGVDFNPTVDRIRVVSNTGQDLRLNPINGSVAAVDTSLAFAAGDVNFGNSPFITAAAYTNNFAGALTTTLYDLDTRAGILVTQNPPNNGTLNTVGSLGVTSTGPAGFDISGVDGTAFASLTVGGVSRLYSINLATGAATGLGAIGNGLAIADISAAAVPEPASFLLGGLGLAGLIALRRRRQSAKV